MSDPVNYSGLTFVTEWQGSVPRSDLLALQTMVNAMLAAPPHVDGGVAVGEDTFAALRSRVESIWTRGHQVTL